MESPDPNTPAAREHAQFGDRQRNSQTAGVSQPATELPTLEAVPQLQRDIGIHIVAGQRVGLAAADPEKSPDRTQSRIEGSRIENPGHKRFSVGVHEPLGRHGLPGVWCPGRVPGNGVSGGSIEIFRWRASRSNPVLRSVETRQL